MDEDPLPDLPSPSDSEHDPSDESPDAEGLDDWIIRNFKVCICRST